ncbi:MAG: DUF45 domain-containing protein [Acholeplasmataceae bacterium]|nr:DUF45 domain-containing protein [Acholeplasmataceae bacterium]MDD4194297.1 DUF45 domain-containing protein [Acholeplasmataceae bacterium]
MTKKVCKNLQCISYVYTRKKIKNTYFRMRQGILYISSPKMLSERDIEKFITDKFDMIYEKLNHYQKESNEFITLWGKTYHLYVSKGNFRYYIENDAVYAHHPKEDIELVKKRIYHVELDQKLQLMKTHIQQTIDRVHIKPLPYKLKYLKSKFGSYHRKHQEITLNTFLARLEPIKLEYVIYHEYAHHLIFNHSKAFYELLSLMMPDHRAHQKDLKNIAIL